MVKRESKSNKNVAGIKDVTPQEKAAERIRKCMTLANDQNAPQGERDAALARAVEIAAKHQLEIADVLNSSFAGLPPDELGMEHRIYEAYEKNKFEVKTWRRTLASGVAIAFYTKCLFVGTDRVMFAGRTTDLEVTEQVWFSLMNQIKQSCDTDIKEAMKKGEAKVHGKGGQDPYAWRKTYMEVAANVLYQRLVDLRRKAVTSMNKDDQSKMTSIVVLTDEAITTYLGQQGIGTKTVKGKATKVRNPGAALAGMAAGERALIGTALTGSEPVSENAPVGSPEHKPLSAGATYEPLFDESEEDVEHGYTEHI